MERRVARWAWLGLWIAAACGGEDEGSGPVDTEPQERGARALGSLDWRPCGDLLCAEVMVPLDPAAPDGEQLPIALNRRAADPTRNSLGVLMFNPGGPGGSGKAFVAAAEALDGFPFEVIGFDPRGVGDSGGLDCELMSDAVARFAAEGAAGAIEVFRGEGQRCRDAVGPLFDHLSTNAVVADIEQLRIALGVEQLSFYGISYGTRIGTAYAQRYPERVRALVLDSPVPPSADYSQLVEAQFDALLAAHQALLSSCEQGLLACPADSAALFGRLLQAFAQAGQREGFLSLWARSLRSPPGRDFLLRLLRETASVTQEQLDLVLTMARMMDAAPPPMETDPEVTEATNVTVNCSDSSVEPPSASEADAVMAAYAQRSELFAPLALPAIVCSGWPAARDPLADVSLRLATPPLILAGVADTLTPLPMAEELHLAIPGSALLISEHYGHGVISFGGECAGVALGRYLGGLELPPDGTVCPAP